jgi:group I intron endonuclease
MYEHKYKLKYNKHANKHLNDAWNKYGANNFLFITIEFVEPDCLIEREQYYIDYYNASNRNYGYNLSPTAGNTLNYKHSEITKQKIRNARLGKKSSRINYIVSDETKKKMSESAKRKPPISDETRKKLSIAQMGNKKACRIVDDAERKLMSEIRKGINRGEKNGMSICDKNEILAIRNDYDNGMSISNIMIKYNKKNSFVYQIVKRLRWKWLN